MAAQSLLPLKQELLPPATPTGRLAVPLIPLKQVLAEMAAAVEPFSILFVKLNGELVELHGQLLSGRKLLGDKPTPPVAPATPKTRRNPNHFANGTRNLRSTINGRYSKVHIYFILGFNGKKVFI